MVSLHSPETTARKHISQKTEIAIVGAGIIGLAHAYAAAKAGFSVAVFERNPAAIGASIRNFGMIWPIGQPAGPLHNMALRSREIWTDVLNQAGLPYFPTGSLHATYQADEAAVGQEFCSKAGALGYDCQWMSPTDTLNRSSALIPDGLLGAVWSPSELTVDPRRVLSQLPHFLQERYNVAFHFNTAVTAIDEGTLETPSGKWPAEHIIVCGGDDFQTLFPDVFAGSGLTRCKLQMLRTVPQPNGWQLGPSLAFGLTFRHYPTFQICESLTALKKRVAHEYPDLDRWGIHVMVSQTALGELTLGDSHEYGLAIDIFDKPAINRIILDYACRHLRVPSLEIAQQWHGVYAKHPEKPFLSLAPSRRVRVAAVTSGIGMTMSFGLAEDTIRQIGLV
jgi:FAD dependent oxidoreductase TIGR03364